MNRTTLFSLCFVIIFIFSGCKKYDDGPTISLRSKKNRLAGKWVTHMWLYNKYEQIYMLDTMRTAEFTKDGKYYYHEYNQFTHKATNLEGTWEFRQEKEQLFLTLPGSTDTNMYQLWDILRLKNDEIWLEMVLYSYPNSDIYEWRLKPE